MFRRSRNSTFPIIVLAWSASARLCTRSAISSGCAATVDLRFRRTSLAQRISFARTIPLLRSLWDRGPVCDSIDLFFCNIKKTAWNMCMCSIGLAVFGTRATTNRRRIIGQIFFKLNFVVFFLPRALFCIFTSSSLTIVLSDHFFLSSFQSSEQREHSQRVLTGTVTLTEKRASKQLSAHAIEGGGATLRANLRFLSHHHQN